MKVLALVLVLVVIVAACAAASGYDPDRYKESPVPSASVDPDTSPLTVSPRTARPLMVDPRSPLDASADRAHDGMFR